MGPTVQAWPVTAYKSIVGNFPAGQQIYLDCDFKFIRNETINPADGSSYCAGNIPAGSSWPAGGQAGTTTVDTVLLNTKDGYVWIKPSDYDGLLTHCNECCI